MTNRKIFDQLKTHLTKKEYTILIGSRQTGKSTLLRQLEHYCQQQQMPVAFINLENKSLLADLNSSPLNLLNYLPETSKMVVVLVDEVQYLDDASKFLKLLHDDVLNPSMQTFSGSCCSPAIRGLQGISHCAPKVCFRGTVLGL